MDVQMVPAVTLSQHPENPNNGDVDAIAESISVNGFYQPIIAQKSTRHILAGNHRYLAALQLGLGEVPVVWVDVDNQAARRILLVDNRTSELGHRDEAQLADLLQNLEGSDLGLMGTGYLTSDYHDLMDLIESPLSPEDFATPDDDDAESADEQPKAKRWLKYDVDPVVSEDGKTYTLSIRKSTGRSIGRNDFNMLLKALGRDPMGDDELARLGVPAWERSR